MTNQQGEATGAALVERLRAKIAELRRGTPQPGGRRSAGAGIDRELTGIHGTLNVIEAELASAASALASPQAPAPANALAVKLAELMAAHRDGQTGENCSDIDDPGSCATCATLDASIKALSGRSAPASPDWRPIADLKRGWDTYDAPPIEPSSIDAAKLFLQRVNIVPCVNGGVQLEWHTHGLDLEIQFSPDGTVESGLENKPLPVPPPTSGAPSKNDKDDDSARQRALDVRGTTGSPRSHPDGSVSPVTAYGAANPPKYSEHYGDAAWMPPQLREAITAWLDAQAPDGHYLFGLFPLGLVQGLREQVEELKRQRHALHDQLSFRDVAATGGLEASDVHAALADQLEQQVAREVPGPFMAAVEIGNGLDVQCQPVRGFGVKVGVVVPVWCGEPFPAHPNALNGGEYFYCPRQGCGLHRKYHWQLEAVAILRRADDA